MTKKMAFLIIALIFFIAGIAALFYFLVFLPQNPPLKEAKLTVGSHTLIVEIADTFMSRAKGLSGRASLPEDRGMLFVFSVPGNYGFWMKGMRFPLDFVWIRGDKVMGITENVPPPAGITDLKTYYPPESVNKVLELNAGVVEKDGLRVGDRVVVE